MKYSEELDWILDKVGKHITDEEKYQRNIAFVHSLGLKCDSVGWSKLDLNAPNADEVLGKIEAFCKSEGWKARGYYKRTYTDVQSDWYEIDTKYFKDDTMAEYFEVPSNNGDQILLMTIRAYHELDSSPKSWGTFYVSERFRNACLKHNIPDIDFCWIKDNGKYEAEQYFAIFPKQQIPHIICDRGLSLKKHQRIEALGGSLPKIANIFYDLQHIELPDSYLASDMPSGGIAYAYCPDTETFCGRNTLLIHKDMAETLIQEKALSANILQPVPIVEELPGGYVLADTKPQYPPTREYMQQMLLGYEKIKCTTRPIRKVSEKDALKVLRQAKSERKEDFNKRMSKEQNASLAYTSYGALAPYYLITNGGYLSDEYKFLSYDLALEATHEFEENLQSEELLEPKPEGVVFAKCPDGDPIFYSADGSVIRYNYGSPEIYNEWTSLADFFFDAITESE